MVSNHRLVLFTHALCRLSYPAVDRSAASLRKIAHPEDAAGPNKGLIARIANLFRASCFIHLFDLGLLVQNHVQQGFMDFDFSVVFDEAQFAEFVHKKTYA